MLYSIIKFSTVPDVVQVFCMTGNYHIRVVVSIIVMFNLYLG